MLVHYGVIILVTMSMSWWHSIESIVLGHLLTLISICEPLGNLTIRFLSKVCWSLLRSPLDIILCFGWGWARHFIEWNVSECLRLGIHPTFCSVIAFFLCWLKNSTIARSQSQISSIVDCFFGATWLAFVHSCQSMVLVTEFLHRNIFARKHPSRVH